PWVSYEKSGQAAMAYAIDGLKPEQLNKLTTRVMDCMDCHNRPSHTFQLAERAVDEAMASGRIATSLPFAKKQAMATLNGKYLTSAEASSKIPAAFGDFYAKNYPEIYRDRAGDVQRSAKT